jgi:anti-sigma factor RsiW
MTDTQLLHQFAVQNLLPEKYLLGELSGADLEDFERHIFECETCFETVKAGQVFTETIAAGVSAPRTSWWQRIKEFCARTFSNSSEEGQQ